MQTQQVVSAILEAVESTPEWEFMERLMRRERGRPNTDQDDEDWLDDCPDGECSMDDDEDDEGPPEDMDDEEDPDEDEPYSPGNTPDMQTDITDTIENYPRKPHRRPTTGLQKYAQKYMGSGHLRFPDRVFDASNSIPIHTINGTTWQEMRIPGGQPPSRTPNRSQPHEQVAEELAEKFNKRTDVGDDAREVSADYLLRPARL